MTELSTKARELADEILVDYGRDATDSPRFRLHVAKVAAKIEQALLGERRDGMEQCAYAICSDCSTNGWPINDEGGYLWHIFEGDKQSVKCRASVIWALRSAEEKEVGK